MDKHTYATAVEHRSRTRWAHVCRAGILALSAVAWSAGVSAASPSGVQTTLEGCRNDGTITLPNGSNAFVCPDSAYTTGNLGKGWNELDLVPHRLTLSAGNSAPASQTYTLAVAVDGVDAGKPGYDVLSTLTKKSGTCSINVGGQQSATPGIGGTDTSLYRLVTVTQAKNTECVFDFYARLALGSHLYPGSSLHANALNESLGTAGIGARDVSIPVKEIKPQELRKDMSATADSEVQWNLTKAADPTSISFGDVCRADVPLSQQVTFRVEWIKTGTTAGAVNVITNIYAKNPAARTITVHVTDRIYKGTTQDMLLDTASTPAAGVDVNANSEQLVLTHTATLSSTAGAVGDYLNDVATATYTDKVTGIAVPGTTTAAASARIGAGTVTNASAAIADSESITGTGLQFSVAQPSVGVFSGYTAGAKTTGPVNWGLSGQTSSGGVDFVKTIYLDAKRVTSGTLTDTATLVASPGTFTKTAGPVNVAITSSASVKLTISKTIPPVLDTGEKIEVKFTVTRSGDATYSREETLTFNAGDTSKSVMVDGLVPDTYIVTEGTATFFAAGSSSGVPSNLQPVGGTQRTATLTAGTDGIFQPSECAATVSFTNAVPQNPASAQVKKITDPEANGGDWTFTLTGPGLPAGGVTKTVTAGAGYGAFDAVLGEGTYYVTETKKEPEWLLVSATPEGAVSDKVCSFTVDFPENIGTTFSCTFTNEKQGKARVVKTAKEQLLTGTAYAFTFELRQGASSISNGNTLEAATANAANGGTVNFAAWLKPGDSYQLCEVVMPGWNTNLANYGTLFVPGSNIPPALPNPEVNNMTVCVNFTVAAGETKTFNVDNSPPPGGLARTIGFWKNWASCANSQGGQKPVLDETLAKGTVIGDTLHTNHSALPGIVVSATSGVWSTFGPTYRLVVHGKVDANAPDCQIAVRLLNKSTISSGKKMASDPAFNLAAQLVAAELNQLAGAYTNGTVISAINEAVVLLGAVGFDGNVHGTISSTQASRMNTLAKLLDDYNNNRL